MNRKLFLLALIGTTFIVSLVFYDYFAYLAYALDLLTANKPCIGIGDYCTFYTENKKCEKGSDYVICEDLPPFFNPNATDWSSSK